MRVLKLAATAAVCALSSGSAAFAATYTETVRGNGVFDFLLIPIVMDQAYEVTITAPGDVLSYWGYVDWIGNRESWFEDGTYNLIGSNNVHRLVDIPLVQDTNTLSATFIAPGEQTIYWPNGNRKTQYVAVFGNWEDMYLGGTVDPSWVGSEVTMTVTAIPEPAVWALMIAGFGLAGAAVRRRRHLVRESS